jgi:arginine deiminase
MTPKEKAEELFVKINKEGLHQISSVIARHVRKQMIKQCALIAVDEVLNFINTDAFSYTNEEYWQEVKQEIEKL